MNIRERGKDTYTHRDPPGSYAQRVFPRPAGQSGLSPKCPWHWSFKVSSLEVYFCQGALSKCAWVGRSKMGELHWKNSTVCGEGECRDHIEYTRERHGSLNTRPATSELSLWFGQSLGNLDGVQPQEKQVREPRLNKRGRERRRGKWGLLISWYTSLSLPIQIGSSFYSFNISFCLASLYLNI